MSDTKDFYFFIGEDTATLKFVKKWMGLTSNDTFMRIITTLAVSDDGEMFM